MRSPHQSTHQTAIAYLSSQPAIALPNQITKQRSLKFLMTVYLSVYSDDIYRAGWGRKYTGTSILEWASWADWITIYEKIAQVSQIR